jgi:hypothetical protein
MYRRRLTDEQLKEIAVTSHDSKRSNTKKNYSVQEAKLQVRLALNGSYSCLSTGQQLANLT